jgi:hypothetical protein
MVSVHGTNGKCTKVKFSPEQATEAREGVEVYFYSFLTTALDGDGWSTPHHGRFPPGKDLVPIA